MSRGVALCPRVGVQGVTPRTQRLTCPCPVPGTTPCQFHSKCAHFGRKAAAVSVIGRWYGLGSLAERGRGDSRWGSHADSKSSGRGFGPRRADQMVIDDVGALSSVEPDKQGEGGVQGIVASAGERAVGPRAARRGGGHVGDADSATGRRISRARNGVTALLQLRSQAKGNWGTNVRASARKEDWFALSRGAGYALPAHP